VLSFVGRGGETRCIAREDISKRILNGQVKMGIMVFERPKVKSLEKSNSIEDVMGTKAWIINHMNNCLENRKFHFVDDSNDHIVITNKYLGSKNNICCYLVDGTLQDAQLTISKINKIIPVS
jgi:metal-responsive CopG/Arc/MetJ family transcriptional regulator